MLKINKIKFITLLIIAFLTIIWCYAIFKLSAMNSESSNDSSTSLVEQGIMYILKITNEYEITNSHPNAENLTYAAELINAPLRKVVHASVYCILAILLIIANVILFNHQYYFRVIFGVLTFCFIFAFFDEYHKTFVEGRTGQLFDVFIDTIGAIFGIIFASSYQLAWWLGRQSNKPNSKSDTI